jgi:LacI family transcriptional regulator
MPAVQSLTFAFQAPIISQNIQAIMRGVCAYVNLHPNWHLRITSESLDKVLPELKARGVDGAFISPASQAHESMALECGIPCILAHTYQPQQSLPYLTGNNHLLGRMAADHFIKKGFTNFSYFSPDNTLFWSSERLEGYTARIIEVGGTVHVFESAVRLTKKDLSRATNYFRWPPSPWLTDTNSLHSWLQSLPKPCALMAADDNIGYDIIEAAEEGGIKVPEELAVIGVNNDLTRCLLSNPQLSSIALDLEQNGYNAAALLHRIILGKEKMEGQRLVTQPTHVVTRQSTDIVAIPDPDLAAALHFIRTNFDRPIKVADVVKQTSASRRLLEIKFREHIRHSITDEIMRVKLDQLTRMLLESDMSMERMADCLAFCSSGVMRKAFRRSRGINPTDFRRLHRKT